MEEDAFVQKVLSDLKFTGKVHSDLRQRPRAFKQLVAYPEVARKIVEDPVFFAVLMCGDSWLADAPDHQKLLRDLSPRQVAVCGRGWGAFICGRTNRYPKNRDLNIKFYILFYIMLKLC
ncbi:hypothetical protein IMZ68_04020 [Candidatus Bathyarchaeota archaeon]|nr:hypothetical protein [Candidatus Bathyarchaeota archaeon]